MAGNMNDETHCPVCGEPWDDHDFGVPHPYCPKEPLPGKSWNSTGKDEKKKEID